MTELRRFRCLSCGRRFEAEVLTDAEKNDAERDARPLSRVRCPDCNREEVRPGWE